MKRISLILFLSIVVTPVVGFAAKRARVEAKSVEVLRSLSPNSGVIEVLPKNTPLVVGNQPSRGYYKVRTPNGNIGWVYGEGLRVFDADGAGSRTRPPAPEPVVREEDRQPIRAGRERPSSGGLARKWFIRALGGLSMYTATDLNTQFGGEAMSGGFAFGGELGYRLSNSFALLVRVEYLTDSASIEQTDISKVYDLSISSLPLMGGFAVQFVDKPSFSLHLNVVGGLGLATSVSATSTLDPAPNETVLSGSGIAILGTLNATYKASPALGIFIEAGYRYLEASTTEITTAGTGDQLFREGLSASGAYAVLPISLSGITFHAGAAFSF